MKINRYYFTSIDKSYKKSLKVCNACFPCPLGSDERRETRLCKREDVSLNSRVLAVTISKSIITY